MSKSMHIRAGLSIPEQWVSVKEASALARVCECTVYRRARQGLILARKLWRGRGPWRIGIVAGLPADAPDRLAGK